jgi:hypothetical protein
MNLFLTNSDRINFRNMLINSSQLIVLSLKNCPHFDGQVLAILNITCNPFTLRELYLDGCDCITDDALEVLSLLPPEKMVVAHEEFIRKNINSYKKQS